MTVGTRIDGKDVERPAIWVVPVNESLEVPSEVSAERT